MKGKIQLKGQEKWISDEGWSSGDKYKQHMDENMRNKQPGTSTRSQGIDIQEQGWENTYEKPGTISMKRESDNIV